MDPRIADLLRHIATGAILLALALFGFKLYKRHTDKNDVVAAMRTDVSEAAFYRSLSEEDARRTFLRCIAHMDRAEKLGMEPGTFLDRVFDRKEKKTSGIDDDAGFPVREKLVRVTLLRAHQHARQLGLLDRPEHLKDLESGEIPPVDPKPVLGTIIDPKFSPGLEKAVPNLELRARPAAPDRELSDLEIAAARELIRDLADANLIVDETAKRLLGHYVAKPPVTPPSGSDG